MECQPRRLSIPHNNVLYNVIRCQISGLTLLSDPYIGAVVHVLDASRSVPVAQALLDAKKQVSFIEDTREQYAEMREEFYAGLEDRRYVTIEQARAKKLQVCPKPYAHTNIRSDLNLSAFGSFEHLAGPGSFHRVLCFQLGFSARCEAPLKPYVHRENLFLSVAKILQTVRLSSIP